MELNTACDCLFSCVNDVWCRESSFRLKSRPPHLAFEYYTIRILPTTEQQWTLDVEAISQHARVLLIGTAHATPASTLSTEAQILSFTTVKKFVINPHIGKKLIADEIKFIGLSLFSCMELLVVCISK